MEKVPLDIPSKEELSEIVRSFPALYDNPTKGLKKNVLRKMHGMELQRCWNLIETLIIFI